MRDGPLGVVVVLLCAPATGLAAEARPQVDEAYMAVYIAGAKCGYMHMQELRTTENGRPVVKVRTHFEATIVRGGFKSHMVSDNEEVSTPAGDLLHLKQVSQLGGKTTTVARVEGRELRITVTNVGGSRQFTLPVADRLMGSAGVNVLLRQQKPRSGLTIALKHFEPDMRQIVGVTATVVRKESAKLIKGTRTLWRVESHMSVMPQMTIVSWVDDEGESWKEHMPVMGGMTMYRVSAAEALSPPETANLDLLMQSLVHLDHPLPAGCYEGREALYEITVADAQVARLFDQPPYQQVEQKDGKGTVRVRIRREPKPPAVPPAPPADEFLKPNAYIQSDDPLIVKLAGEAAGTATEPMAVCRRLTTWVRKHVTEKTYSTAFATASDVARNKQGDCSEHAVLLAALARAKGIPSRIAVGLIYLKSGQAFAYHMWTEVFVGRWIGVDGTGGWVYVPPTHIKIADHSMREGSGLAALLPVLQLIGKLKIRVLNYRL